MSTASDTAVFPPPPSAPSVFISYASEDRTAARALRDALSAAGLDVWYDENELSGGDAWDQKIRRQIRDCEYFMPVISATTEARKEGYFRREWRLAVERSLDMADDVLFLIPVTIDATIEAHARVPDKFLTVQWLRLPGGNATPALHHLVRRILSGNHQALTRPPMAYNRPPTMGRTQAPFGTGEPPPLTSTPPPTEPAHDGPLPMPPMPHVPEKGGFLHGIKFLAEFAWWGLTAAWLLFKRLPRWARGIVCIWIVITLFSSRSCSNGGNNGPSSSERKANAALTTKETEAAIKTAVDEFATAAREARKKGNNVDLAKIGEQIAKNFGQNQPGAIDGPAMNKRLVLLPFSRLSNSEEPAEKFASAVFAALYGRLTLTHQREVGLLRQPPGAAGDAALFNRGKALNAAFVLTGRLTGDADARALEVRLLVTEDGSVKWTETYPVSNADASDIADKIADKADELLPAHREGPHVKPPQPPAQPDKSDKSEKPDKPEK